MQPERLSSLVALLAVAAACTPPPSSSSSAQDVADITQATHDWVAAFEAEDISATLTFLAEGAVLVPPNQPKVAGIASIEAWTEQLFANATIEEAATVVDEVRVAGDWAVSHGAWGMTLSVDGNLVTDTTRYVLIWLRHADGSWKVAYDVWNSGLPAQPGE